MGRTSVAKVTNINNITNIADMNASRAKTIMNTTSELWGKRTAIVPTDLCEVDYDYQRVVTANVNAIQRDWDRNLCDYLVGSYRNDRFYIIDGQHRYYAALANGVEDLPMIVHTGLTKEDEARLFVKLNTTRKPLKPIDTFKANLICGNESIPEVKRDMTIKRVCDDYNIVITDVNYPSKARRLRALTTARRIIEHDICGESCLRWIFEIFKATDWKDSGEPYMDSVLSAIKTYYTDNLDDLDKAKQRLINMMNMYSPTDFIAYANEMYSGYGRYARLSNALRVLA